MPYYVKNVSRAQHTRRMRQRTPGRVNRTVVIGGILRVGPTRGRHLPDVLFKQFAPELSDRADTGQLEVWRTEGGCLVERVFPAPAGKVKPPTVTEIESAGYTPKAAKAIAQEEAKKAEDGAQPYGDKSPPEESGDEKGEKAKLPEGVAADVDDGDAEKGEPSPETEKAKAEDPPPPEPPEDDLRERLMAHKRSELEGILDSMGLKYSKRDNKAALVEKIVEGSP